MENKKDIAKHELDRQFEIMSKVKDIIIADEIDTGKRKTYFVFTTGCKMNTHDSEKLSGMLECMGYIPAQSEKVADFIIYNTCCIRENAEDKIYGKLGSLKQVKLSNPNLKIAICGCMTQQDVVIEKIKKSYRFVDIVFGTFNLYRLPELLLESMNSQKTIFDIWEEDRGIIEDIPTIQESSFRASVTVMYGCNNFCSYCIVPYVRGRERSRELADILNEVKKLVADGAKEIMLLGQNVNSYGKNLEKITSFADLLRMINGVEGLERIRFMTSHPKDISKELIIAMKECKKVGTYIHLPIQSGSNKILERMNRHYTKEKYLSIVEQLKTEIPGIHISTDIIVGFPGETEEDFMETIDVAKKVRFSTNFTFIYSKRTGTPAATMENQIPEEIIKDRFERLLGVLNPIVNEINTSQVGNTYDILVEEVSKHDTAILTGRSENNSLVHFKGNKDLIGKLVPVKITGNKTFYLIGERV